MYASHAVEPSSQPGCRVPSRHLAERDLLNSLARVARRAWTTDEMSGCGVEDVTALVACSNLVQGLDYLCVPVTAYVLWAFSILRTTMGRKNVSRLAHSLSWPAEGCRLVCSSALSDAGASE